MPKPWNRDDDRRTMLLIGLRKGLKLIHGARRTFSEEEQDTIAAAILESLRQSGFEIDHPPGWMGKGPLDANTGLPPLHAGPETQIGPGPTQEG